MLLVRAWLDIDSPSAARSGMVVAGRVDREWATYLGRGRPLFGGEVIRMRIQIELDEGTEAAAEIPNEQFQTLVRVVVWELAMRTSRDQFEEHVRQLSGLHTRFGSDLETARKERDHRRFIASVLEDIRSLPSEPRTEPSTGLYL
jgi:hypothetical protein